MKRSIRNLTVAGLIASFYVVFTLLSSFLNLAYGPIQFRFSEALTVLAAITPAAIPGLTVGCIIANLNSPYGILDVCFGTVATLLAALCAAGCKKIKWKGIPWLSIAMPAIFNSIIIGAEITLFTEGGNWLTFLYSGFTVGIGELLVCYVLGIPLYLIVSKYQSKLFPHY